MSDAAPSATPAAIAPPPVRHVFVINLENKGYDETFGPDSPAPYLSSTLRLKGQLLTQYYGTAHNSLPNYLGQISGQGPDSQTQADCQVFSDFVQSGTGAPQQAVGNGCVYPTNVKTVADQLKVKGLGWRGYMEDMGTPCRHNSTATSTMPTIWDRLAGKGVSRAYYYVDVPFLALYGTKYLDISRTWPQFLADAAAGTLPSVSYLDPKFLDEGSGTSADDHPHADIRAGQSFINQVYEAITRGPGWSRTALAVNYDEWGGFFDHVRPGSAPDATPSLGTGRRGFRTPALLVSPRARRHHVSYNVYDHTSVLKMIEWRWGLSPLTPRDAAARNMAEVLDFANPPSLVAPRWAVPPAVSAPCGPEGTADYEDWRALRAKADTLGWRVGGTL